MVQSQPSNMVSSFSKDVENALRDDRGSIESPTDGSNEAILHDGSEEGKRAFLASFSAAEDKAIMRKVDWRFLWLIGITYLIKNIDYTNASNVKNLQVGQSRNIMNELHMTSDQYNWVQSIYFISYIVFEVPSNLMLKRSTPRTWQTRIVVSWGIVLACHAAVQNASGYYVARFFLGVMEAGMFPGFAAQLCSWYRTDEMGKPIMWLFGLQNCSGIIGSLLAYGISYMNGLASWSAWRWVYLLEGLATILWGLVIYLVLPDYPKSPRSNKWLTRREQEYLELRLPRNAAKTSDPAFSKKEIMACLKDARTYGFMISQFMTNFAGYGLQWQLPTITTDLGFAGLPRNQLLNIAPAACSVLGIVIAGWLLRRAFVPRPGLVISLGSGQLIFFVLLATLSNKIGIYISCVLGIMFYSVWFIPFWSWRSATLSGATGAAFGLAFQNCIGQVGGVIAPQLFLAKYAYNGYKTPFAVMSVMVGGAWLLTAWNWYLTRELEADVRRVKKLRNEAEERGEVYAGEDIAVGKSSQEDDDGGMRASV